MVLLIVVMLALLIIPKWINSADDEKNTNEIERDSTEIEKSQKNTFPKQPVDYFINDSIYKWDDEEVNWMVTGEVARQKKNYNPPVQNKISLHEPIKIKWETLMDIRYRLKYLTQIKTNVFTPLFSEDLKKYHSKEVILEGFVIPYDEEGKFLALSYNPYASCFFCGNASPASVISMYMRNADELYELDDFRKFKGKFYLNEDDPDQFYYILKNVVPM